MVGPFPALSELIAARVHVPPSAVVPASTCAASCPVGCHVPAPGCLQPSLFILADSAQHSCRLQQPYPHLLSSSSFHQGPISPSAPSFSPISLPPHTTLSLILRRSPTPWPRQTLSPVLAETTHSLSSCIFSWGPRTFPRPQPILDSPLQGRSAQPKDATAASTGEVQHQVCALREKHERSPLLGKEEKCSL